MARADAVMRNFFLGSTSERQSSKLIGAPRTKRVLEDAQILDPADSRDKGSTVDIDACEKLRKHQEEWQDGHRELEK
jgi:hypothetical protein